MNVSEEEKVESILRGYIVRPASMRESGLLRSWIYVAPDGTKSMNYSCEDAAWQGLRAHLVMQRWRKQDV